MEGRKCLYDTLYQTKNYWNSDSYMDFSFISFTGRDHEPKFIVLLKKMCREEKVKEIETIVKKNRGRNRLYNIKTPMIFWKHYPNKFFLFEIIYFTLL